MAVQEHASIDDNQLHLYSLEMAAIWKLLFMAPAFRAGTHGAWREVRVEDGHRFEVRTRRPRPVNADGEIITQTPAVFSVRPAALEVFVPAL
jgi:diacylglycerol kinase family enzyme